jgi:hypothetical protein
MTVGPSSGRRTRRRVDDAGGVWIITGLVLGAIVYAGMVLMAVAGFTAVIPLVVIPPVLVAIIAANSLLGGGRGSSRSPQTRDLPAGPGGAGRTNGSGRPPSGGAAPTPGEPRGPR